MPPLDWGSSAIRIYAAYWTLPTAYLGRFYFFFLRFTPSTFFNILREKIEIIFVYFINYFSDCKKKGMYIERKGVQTEIPAFLSQQLHHNSCFLEKKKSHDLIHSLSFSLHFHLLFSLEFSSFFLLYHLSHSLLFFSIFFLPMFFLSSSLFM